MLTILLNISESKEIAAGVIEYTVKNNLDVFFMTCLYKGSQIFVGSKTGIQFLIICSFISVSDTFKKWTNVQSSTSDFFDVIDPGKKSIQTVHWFTVIILLWSTRKA